MPLDFILVSTFINCKHSPTRLLRQFSGLLYVSSYQPYQYQIDDLMPYYFLPLLNNQVLKSCTITPVNGIHIVQKTLPLYQPFVGAGWLFRLS